MSDPNQYSVELGRDVVTLSFDGLHLAPDILSHVFELPDGGWGVSSDVFGGAIQLFDPDGEPAGTLGRAGQGPSEFGGKVFAAVVDGELWTVDPHNARLSAFNESLELVAERQLPGRIMWATSSGDESSMLVTGFLDGGTQQHGIARLTMDEGEDVFGVAPEEHPNPRVQIHMAVQPGNDASVWTVAVMGGGVNVLEASDLTIGEHLQLPDEDLEVHAEEGVPTQDGPPPPHLAGVLADEEGILWFLFAVPARGWTPDLTPGDGIHRLLDTLILAVDPSEAAVVGRETLDEVCFPVVRGRISCVDEVDASISIVELTLVTGGG